MAVPKGKKGRDDSSEKVIPTIFPHVLEILY